MRRVIVSLALPALTVLLCSGSAGATTNLVKVVVVPIQVWVSPEPDPALVSAVAEGLRQNARWVVDYGAKGHPLSLPSEQGLPPAELQRYEDRAAEGARLLSGDPTKAIQTLETLWNDLRAAKRSIPLGERGDALLLRAGGLLVAAHRAAGQQEQAQTLAAGLPLLAPGRKLADVEGIPADALDLVPPTVVTDKTPKVTLKTRPEGCEVVVDGQKLGKAPVELPVTPDAAYWAQALCPATGTQKAEHSFPKRISFTKDEASRTEVLDAVFEQALVNDASGTRLTFLNSDERRQLEESYARRTAEALGAEVVVFVSVGELSGTDWLNGRLFLRNGFRNRQGLVRLEVPRAAALGQYLATGKDMAGVLRREDAVAFAQRSQPNTNAGQPVIKPWYTDIPGWALTGAGAVGIGVGLWVQGKGEDKSRKADMIMNDPYTEQDIRKEASTLKFWGSVGLIGGAVMGVTGLVLLATPEYTGTRGELFVLSPLPGGGMAGALRGTF